MLTGLWHANQREELLHVDKRVFSLDSWAPVQWCWHVVALDLQQLAAATSECWAYVLPPSVVTWVVLAVGVRGVVGTLAIAVGVVWVGAAAAAQQFQHSSPSTFRLQGRDRLQGRVLKGLGAS